MIYHFRASLMILFLSSCVSLGLLKFEADITNRLKEVSALEIDHEHQLFWTIEDSGNENNLYGLNKEGDIVRSIDISNAQNVDWEDLSVDDEGNIYIGDIGNNSKQRSLFRIYKVNKTDLNKDAVKAEIVEFSFPDLENPKDMEAFVVYNGFFFLFSKESGAFKVLRVPNRPGRHTAEVVTSYNLDGKHNRITSAALSKDKTTLVLLNHDKLWKLKNFTGYDFFSGSIEVQRFQHDSQKEGICFKNANEVYISDERSGSKGGNIYSFLLN